MKSRRSHYEMAFEACLNRRGTPYVAIDDVRHFVKGRLGAKAFDYIVYPAGRQACLVDVKGRKISASAHQADARSNNWVTRADLDGLREWQDIFGAEYTAAFVFSFWLAGEEAVGGCHAENAHGGVSSFAGRHYSFWLADVGDYTRLHKQRSVRWNTVNIPTEDFRRISQSLDTLWPAAPC